MEQVCTVGLDIAKNVFQVHGVDESGTVLLHRQVRRRQVLALFGNPMSRRNRNAMPTPG